MHKQQIKKIAGLFSIIFACSVFSFSVTQIVSASEQIEKINVSYDNELNSRTPDIVKDASVYISIGRRITYGDESMRYIGKLDVSSLNSTEMETAVLTMDRVSTSWDGNGDYSLYKVNESWDSSTVTWNNQPAINIVEITRGVVGSYGIMEFNISNLAKEWANDPESNNGFLIMKSEESSIPSNEYGLFASSNYPEAGCETIPYLSITYINEDPAIAIISPNGGEVWENGKTYTITWEQENVDKLTIFLQRGSTGYPVVYNHLVDINAEFGSYDYTVPENVPEAENYKIWIIAYKTGFGQAQDYSDNYFNIREETLFPEINGDLDHDGDVDYDDFMVFYGAWGSCEGDPRFNPEADFYQDGYINFIDYQYFIVYYREFNGL
ncbi:MAG: GPI anchored serine-threonine rich family protein [Candidatus Pacebacteria bacterium]|nr:GPI anchored serine-threonine rich family protein [Candidatus Paceibacterota bacterium]